MLLLLPLHLPLPLLPPVVGILPRGCGCPCLWLQLHSHRGLLLHPACVPQGGGPTSLPATLLRDIALLGRATAMLHRWALA